MKLFLCLLVLLPVVFCTEEDFFNNLTEEEKRNLFHIHVPSASDMRHWATNLFNKLKAAGLAHYSHAACVRTCKTFVPSPINLGCEDLPIIHNGICHQVDNFVKSHGGKREITVDEDLTSELTEEEKRNLFHIHVPSASDMRHWATNLFNKLKAAGLAHYSHAACVRTCKTFVPSPINLGCEDLPIIHNGICHQVDNFVKSHGGKRELIVDEDLTSELTEEEKRNLFHIHVPSASDMRHWATNLFNKLKAAGLAHYSHAACVRTCKTFVPSPINLGCEDLPIIHNGICHQVDNFVKSHGGKRELTVDEDLTSELTEEEKRNLFHIHVPSASDMRHWATNLFNKLKAAGLAHYSHAACVRTCKTFVPSPINLGCEDLPIIHNGICHQVDNFVKSHGGKRELTVDEDLTSELTEEEKRNLFHIHVPSASDMRHWATNLFNKLKAAGLAHYSHAACVRTCKTFVPSPINLGCEDLPIIHNGICHQVDNFVKSHGGKREVTVDEDLTTELTEEEKRNLFHIHVPSASDMRHWATNLFNKLKAAGLAHYSHTACVRTCKTFVPSPINLGCEDLPIIHNGICHQVDNFVKSHGGKRK